MLTRSISAAALAISVLGPGSFSATAQEPVAITLEGYRFEGVTLYDEAALLSFATGSLIASGASVTPRGVADIVEQVYREDGYFLAEVTARPAPGGGVRLSVYEGRIGEISIEGAEPRMAAAVRRYIAPLAREPVARLDTFERALMLSDDLSGAGVEAEIDYPAPDADARLRLVVTETASQSGSLSVDHSPRRIGKTLDLHLSQEFYSSAVAGDFLGLDAFANSDFELEDDFTLFGSLRYRAPVGAGGAYAEGYASNLTARRGASGSFAETEIDGETYALAFGYPFIRNIHGYGYGILDIRRSSSVSRVPGEEIESAVDVVGATYVHGHSFDRGGSLEAAVNLSFGQHRALTPGIDDGDADFWHLRAGIGYEAPLDRWVENAALRAELIAQYTTSRLPGVEEFYLGSADSLRGYRFDEADGDSGLGGSVEVSQTIYPASGGIDRLTPYGFVDFGYIENNDPGAFEQDSTSLASVGLGLEAVFGRVNEVDMYVGVPLADGPVTAAGDPAVYLRYTRSW
ncbi:ShlB/FhaC/HecB family hemolysin secretion/activation protein [Rhodovulum sp. YNF3179]|uniref:ShlB/FhaC/HecB family hemolysin secretion/activation protein n=1 Tax=Rhodovulum sp. YNF3179 TaxID=3425127 RepID=UPI003D350EA7